MTEVLPLVLIFVVWVPIAAGITWIFERGNTRKAPTDSRR
jgi:hypothetical protein